MGMAHHTGMACSQLARTLRRHVRTHRRCSHIKEHRVEQKASGDAAFWLLYIYLIAGAKKTGSRRDVRNKKQRSELSTQQNLGQTIKANLKRKAGGRIYALSHAPSSRSTHQKKRALTLANDQAKQASRIIGIRKVLI